MTDHSPEPWHGPTRSDADWQRIFDANGKEVADDGSAGGEYSVVLSQADASRIIACVNACAGMAEPAAEIAALRPRRLPAIPDPAGAITEEMVERALLAQIYLGYGEVDRICDHIPEPGASRLMRAALTAAIVPAGKDVTK